MSMKKRMSILRWGEISFADLLHCLLKNAWVALLIALAAALTVWTAVGASSPSEYISELTIALRSTQVSENWNQQFGHSRSAASKLTKSINDRVVTTDFATQQFNRSFNVTARASNIASPVDTTNYTNLITITAASSTGDEAYIYLTALADHLDRLVLNAGLTNIAVETVTEPTMPTSGSNDSARLIVTLLAAVVAGGITVLLIVLLRLLECSLATRKAAERLSVRPIAGALKKGRAGRGIDACLPLPTEEKADGVYVKALNDAASFMLKQKEKKLQIASPTAQNASPEETERLALVLALAMAGQGADICLVDGSGYARKRLAAEETAEQGIYKVKGSRLTLSASIAETDRFDKVIYAAAQPTEGEDTHTLWVCPAGRYTAKQLNGRIALGGSASLLLYGLYTIADTKSSADQPKERREDEEEDIDLLKWLTATLGTMWKIKYKWLASFAVVTVLVLAAGQILGSSTHRMQTEFTVLTDDVRDTLTADQLAALTFDQAVEWMNEGVQNGKKTVYGDGLCPSSEAYDLELLMKTMPVIWNTQMTVQAIECQLGHTDIAERVSVSANPSGARFILSVEGKDSANLSKVTDAFFEVAPSLSAKTANGLSFFANESYTTESGPNVLRLLIVAWALVIVAGVLYALIAGYFDRKVRLGYEAEEVLSAPLIGKMPMRAAKDEIPDAADLSVAEPARFLGEWAGRQTGGKVLLVTSALLKEGSARLTHTAEALLRQSGKRVALADETVCARILTEGERALAEYREKYDVLLLDCPGMAVDSDAAALADKADAILWAVRLGYADRERLEGALSACPHEKLLGCVTVT